MRSFRFVVKPILLLILLMGLSLSVSAQEDSQFTYDDYIIYDDGLGEGWQDWSYTTMRPDLEFPQPFSGATSISAIYTNPYESVMLALPIDVSANNYYAIRFALYGNTPEQRVNIALIKETTEWTNPITLSVIPDEWTVYEIPLAEFENLSYITGLIIQEGDGESGRQLVIDEIKLVGATVDTTTAGPDLEVDLRAPTHQISDLIYGMNFADQYLASELGLPINRWGGNPTSRYNWKIDATNRGQDWFFENIPSFVAEDAVLPEQSDANTFIEGNQRNGTASIMTAPMLGWVPKSREYLCSFAVPVYGAQEEVDPGRPACGNGFDAEGEPIVGNDPTETSIPVDENYIREWVSYLVTRYGTAENGGVDFFALDNEPMLWHVTHRDVRPNPVTEDEFMALTVDYANAIKLADPSINILGPTVWGWTAFFYTAQESEDQTWKNDRGRFSGNEQYFIERYLTALANYEQETGQRLLDYLDIHFYPQTDRVALAPAGGESIQTRRLRSTRLLWDADYTAESWIDEPVALIPRMHTWVGENYPETKLALTEYNWGGLEHINGAVTQADVLGIFGREQLDLATLWDPPTSEQPGAYAFRMYRNYDGLNNTFGDLSLSAQSDNPDELSIFASRRSADNAVTIMVVNKSYEALSSTINLDGDLPTDSASVFRYSEADLMSIVKDGERSIDQNRLSETYPPQSITLFVIDDPTPEPTSMPESVSNDTATEPQSVAAVEPEVETSPTAEVSQPSNGLALIPILGAGAIAVLAGLGAFFFFGRKKPS